MRITNARRDEQGEWVFDMNLNEQETSFLVELSITSLLKVGMIKINETEEEQEIDLSLMNAQPATGAIQ